MLEIIKSKGVEFTIQSARYTYGLKGLIKQDEERKRKKAEREKRKKEKEEAKAAEKRAKRKKKLRHQQNQRYYAKIKKKMEKIIINFLIKTHKIINVISIL